MAPTKVMSSVTELAWERGWVTEPIASAGAISLSASSNLDREPTSHLDLSELRLSDGAVMQLRRDVPLLRIAGEEKAPFTLPPVCGVAKPSLTLNAGDDVGYPSYLAQFRIDEGSSLTPQESRALQYLSEGVGDTCSISPELKKHFYSKDDGVSVVIDMASSSSTPISAVAAILDGCLKAQNSETRSSYWAASILHLSEAAHRLNQGRICCRISLVPRDSN